jgi:hypothetical protein
MRLQDYETKVMEEKKFEGKSKRIETLGDASGMSPTLSQPSLQERERQWALASMPAIKILVKEEGWYRVSAQDLAAAGFDPRISSRYLHLYVDGREQPIRVINQKGKKVESLEAIEFLYERGWTDGLPIVPPTLGKVQEMFQYAARSPLEVLGEVEPLKGQATVEKIAVNAVMAGCRPEYLPVISP